MNAIAGFPLLFRTIVLYNGKNSYAIIYIIEITSKTSGKD